jgi:hypothetical protein
MWRGRLYCSRKKQWCHTVTGLVLCVWLAAVCFIRKNKYSDDCCPTHIRGGSRLPHPGARSLGRQPAPAREAIGPRPAARPACPWLVRRSHDTPAYARQAPQRLSLYRKQPSMRRSRSRLTAACDDRPRNRRSHARLEGRARVHSTTMTPAIHYLFDGNSKARAGIQLDSSCRRQGLGWQVASPLPSATRSTATGELAAARRSSARRKEGSARPNPTRAANTRALCRPRGVCVSSRQYSVSFANSTTARSPPGSLMRSPVPPERA